MSVRITCIKKDNGNHENPYTAIKSMSWLDEDNQDSGTNTREAMYEFVKDGGQAYVKDVAGNKAKLVARITDKGTK